MAPALSACSASVMTWIQPPSTHVKTLDVAMPQHWRSLRQEDHWGLLTARLVPGSVIEFWFKGIEFWSSVFSGLYVYTGMLTCTYVCMHTTCIHHTLSHPYVHRKKGEKEKLRLLHAFWSYPHLPFFLKASTVPELAPTLLFLSLNIWTHIWIILTNSKIDVNIVIQTAPCCKLLLPAPTSEHGFLHTYIVSLLILSAGRKQSMMCVPHLLWEPSWQICLCAPWLSPCSVASRGWQKISHHEELPSQELAKATRLSFFSREKVKCLSVATEGYCFSSLAFTHPDGHLPCLQALKAANSLQCQPPTQVPTPKGKGFGDIGGRLWVTVKCVFNICSLPQWETVSSCCRTRVPATRTRRRC